MPLEIIQKLPQLLKPGQSLQKAQANWSLISDRLSECAIMDEYNLAGMCATVAVETAHTFEPLKEEGSAAYFTRMYYNNPVVRKQLGNVTRIDAVQYAGKGFIQITGRANYEAAAKALNEPTLVTNPELACQPELAAKIAVWFWESRGLPELCEEFSKVNSRYISGLWLEVRRRVNGGLNGLEEFLSALRILDIALPGT